ncbi:hypothetical protein X777_16756 [Ooceraea biroi]|uniref:Transmembrane protein n=1 Tax=Ooceraea biroi TaxID=2015173 RepID=A0A026VTS3_OOCBI|nr:hypothetical protein X777_16756 [Ooceraea biroi]
MYEQAASNWAVRLYSLFDPTNFLPLFPNVWNKRVLGSSRYPDDTKVRDTDILVGYLILFWIMLYLLYEKCLNSLFRRMRFPLIQRSRIIKATWYCGFCFGSICYMRSLATQILSFAAHKQGMMYQELGVALHKSFYLHQAGIDILCHGAWIKGCANLLFASFILNPYQQKIYLYLYYVPVFMLWSEEANYTGVEPGLWLWFAIECLDSVLLRLIGHAKATHWLEICLFPPPSQEAIELAGIHKRHRESLKKSNERTAKKVELWQTLICAMAIKKKIKRIRQTRNNIDSSSLDNSEEMELLETHVGDEMPEKELEGNYT